MLSELAKTNWNHRNKQKGQHITCKTCWGKVQTFFSFFIFEGGHRPFFLIFRFRRSLFLLSLIFFANFILSFCSALSCSFDSNGRFSTGTTSSSLLWASSLLPEEGSPPAPSMSEEALAINKPVLLMVKGVRIRIPLKDCGCRSMGFMCNLETGNQKHKIWIWVVLENTIKRRQIELLKTKPR